MNKQIVKDIVGGPLSQIEKNISEGVTESGFYANDYDNRWEIWYVSEDGLTVDMLGFSQYNLGLEIKEYWKLEFYQRWNGLRNDVPGWEC